MGHQSPSVSARSAEEEKKSSNQDIPDYEDQHSSIGSCDLSTGECEINEALEFNIHRYSESKKKTSYNLFEEAVIGTSNKYYRIDDNFIKVGEFQYIEK